MINEELHQIINHLKESTKKTYIQTYNRLIKSQLFDRSVLNTGEEKIIENIKLITDNPNSRQALLNIAIMIKHANYKPHDKLIAFRDELKDDIEKHHEKKDIILNEELPEFKYLYTHMEEQFDTGKPSYIINFLLLNFCI